MCFLSKDEPDPDYEITIVDDLPNDVLIEDKSNSGAFRQPQDKDLLPTEPVPIIALSQLKLFNKETPVINSESVEETVMLQVNVSQEVTS